MTTRKERHLQILRNTRAMFVERYGEKDRSVEFIDTVIRDVEAGADSVEALVASDPATDWEYL